MSDNKNFKTLGTPRTIDVPVTGGVVIGYGSAVGFDVTGMAKEMGDTASMDFIGFCNKHVDATGKGNGELSAEIVGPGNTVQFGASGSAVGVTNANAGDSLYLHTSHSVGVSGSWSAQMAQANYVGRLEKVDGSLFQLHIDIKSEKDY